MTRRILLTLADDATDTHCGSCQYVHDVTAWCVPFWDGASAGAGGIRDPRCIAAEAAAKQDDSDRQLGELARASLHLCVVRMEKGDAWPTAELAAYGPTAAAFIDALRKAQK